MNELLILAVPIIKTFMEICWCEIMTRLLDYKILQNFSYNYKTIKYFKIKNLI